jgi:hypothetical protein
MAEAADPDGVFDGVSLMRSLRILLSAALLALLARVASPVVTAQTGNPACLAATSTRAQACVDMTDARSTAAAISPASAAASPGFLTAPARSATLRQARAMLQAPSASVLVPGTPQLRQPPRANAVVVAQNPRLGVNFANYYVNGNGPRAYAQMRAAGASTDRITFNMNAIASAPNTYNWVAYDAVISDAKAVSMSVLGVLIAPSDFASTACPPGSGTIFRTPANTELAWNDANNHWARWVSATVARYKDTVRAWEVWNEPNLPVFWCGTEAQLAQVTRVSYQAIKAADPSTLVVSAPIFRGANIEKIARFFEALRDLPDARANNFYHDVTGYHLYDGGHCSSFDEIGFLVTNYISPNIGLKPMWNSESGIRVREGDWPEFATAAGQSNYLISNYAYSLHKNVGKYFFWRAIDERALQAPADYDSAWGLLEFNGTPRPAYQTYQTVAQYLPTDFEWSVRRFGNRFSDNRENGPVSRITFYNTNLGRVSVLFNITNTVQPYTFTAVLSNATFVSPEGALETRQPVSGVHVLSMPASTDFRGNFPQCQTPGRPVIIIEADTIAPTATLQLQSVPVTTTSGFTLTWSSADDAAGAGIWWHDVQIQKDGGTWQTLREEVAGTALRFDAPPDGGVYAFRVRPRDRAGNAPAWEAMNIVSTTVLLNLPLKLWLPLAVKR